MTAPENLAGGVAVVTGSGRNIGRAIARELASAGAAAMVNARRSAAEAEAVADDIRKAGGRAKVKIADITDPDAAAALIAAAVESFGRLDILVNNAAGRRGSAEEIAALVRFLCGPEARYITGQTIHANGGVFMA